MAETSDGWFVSATGARLFVADPSPGVISLDDIAHALSLLCRFGGHCRTFYSVAQHSVHVSTLVPQSALRVMRQGLLHDAAEAYLGDVISPLKRLLPGYQKLEARWWRAIAEHFGIEERVALDVKLADRVALVTERRDLSHHRSGSWPWREDEMGAEPDPAPILPVEPTEARELFVARFRELFR